MQYPTLLEYMKAIQDAGNNLDKLSHLSVVLDGHGEPYHISGDSSVVFKMQDKTTGKCYALKCFTKAQKGCADASSTSSSMKYLEKELLVLSQGKEEKYPVLLMDWVDGDSLGASQLKVEDMSTEATKAELNEAITDEFSVKYSKDGRKLLKVPQKLKGTYAIKEGTKIICDRAFEDCKSLRSLVIPNSVTSIGESAFSFCSSLKSIVLPESVVSIKGNLFCKWNGEAKCLSPNFIFEDGVLFNKDKSTIISFRDKDITSYVIPDYVTSIGGDAFSGCESLTSLVIPDSVVSIGDGAFSHCDSLKNIVLPNGITSIGLCVFQHCRSLKSLVIPDSVTSIDTLAFCFCSSLKSIVIPDGVTCIGDGAFNGCESLKSIVIPDSVTCIGNRAFEYCFSLKSLVLSKSLTSIGDYAFSGCRSLKSLVISNSVTDIAVGAFLSCTSLSSVVIPDGVTSIGEGAFIGCESLKSIVIPDGVVSIEKDAFRDCNFPNDFKQKLISRFGDKIFG